MGTERVARQVAAMSDAALREWYRYTLSDMARQGGTDCYCGNWNSNEGLDIVSQSFSTQADAQKYAEKHVYKRGPVLALRIGDFKKVFPVSKADQALTAKAEELTKAVDEFDWHVRDRAQKAKSKIRKCPHCESGINVHKLDKPKLADYLKAESGDFDTPYMFCRGGLRTLSFFRGLTDCPVCGKNLLKTATDFKSFKSLEVRLQDVSKKHREAKAAYDAKQVGSTNVPYFYIMGDCGS